MLNIVKLRPAHDGYFKVHPCTVLPSYRRQHSAGSFCGSFYSLKFTPAKLKPHYNTQPRSIHTAIFFEKFSKSTKGCLYGAFRVQEARKHLGVIRTYINSRASSAHRRHGSVIFPCSPPGGGQHTLVVWKLTILPLLNVLSLTCCNRTYYIL